MPLRPQTGFIDARDMDAVVSWIFVSFHSGQDRLPRDIEILLTSLSPKKFDKADSGKHRTENILTAPLSATRDNLAVPID